MSDLTPETLAELRRLLSEAPPLPYRDSLGSHGLPSDGPTYVALEAQLEGPVCSTCHHKREAVRNG